MNKIVITGALGHIGSKLIRHIPTKIDAEIVMIDNMSAERYCSLFDLPKAVKYKFYEKNILDANLEEIFEGSDVVIHLAAITNAAGSFDKQSEVEEVNFIGTKKVVDACMKTDSKLIFLSTTSVYGTQEEIVDENCSKDELQPQSPYARAKLQSEEFLQGLKDKVDFIILRFGTIYGYSIGMRFHTAVNKFCFQAVMNRPITVWETAYNQKRPYLDLEDAVNSLVYIIENNIFDGEVYNVLTQNFTVKDIVDTIKENIDDVEIEFVKTKIMNQLSYDVSNEKFKRKGFEYRGDVHNAIAQTISVLRNSNGVN